MAKRTHHVAPNNIAICCVGMLRSFGRGFMVQSGPLEDLRNEIKDELSDNNKNTYTKRRSVLEARNIE